jgi:hypothetical protein
MQSPLTTCKKMLRNYSYPDPHGSPIKKGRHNFLNINIDWPSILKHWLIDYLLFYVLLKNFSIIWSRYHYQWRAAKFKPLFSTQSLWTGRNLYPATPSMTWGLGVVFWSHTKDCPIQSPLTTHKGMWRIKYMRSSNIISIQTTVKILKSKKEACEPMFTCNTPALM